ncbi:hypothetical protein [Frigidibacter sp. ROC022]|uniref:hypothetical protein n=1 Tax=Frigidibacter sp. ROC022 TaxID=2971796 RepID=UPI00215AE43A|nr:hypothetical protein [Frigidibacter sp. ROC022]MCR8724046.1 hypothetical protein [Frigidibacter sp. ROC022]
MSHPVPLPPPRLTKADLATLRYLIERSAGPLQPEETERTLPAPSGLCWLEQRFPTI